MNKRSFWPSVGMAVLMGGLMGVIEARAESPMTLEQFKARVEYDPKKDSYTVDGDVVLHGREELQKYWEVIRPAMTKAHVDSTVENFSLANVALLNVGNVVAGEIGLWTQAERCNLTYCVSDAFEDKKAVVDAIRAAAEDWMAVAGVKFSYVPSQDKNCSSGDGPKTNKLVMFLVQPNTMMRKSAEAFFPKVAPENMKISINWAIVKNDKLLSPKGILLHELGHVLGFRHEHLEVVDSEEKCDARTGVGKYKKISAEIPYDRMSVMHHRDGRGFVYKNGPTEDYKLTDSDRKAARLLYPGSCPK